MSTLTSHFSLLTSLLMVLLPASAALAADMTLTIRDVPAPGLISFKPDQPLDAKAAYALKTDGETLPAQLDRDGRLWWYQPRPCIGDQVCTCTLVRMPDGVAGAGGIKVEKAREGRIDVTIDGQPFTTFNYGKNLPKPFLYPVIGPTGAAVTRHYPMQEVASEPRNRRDHPHHRSLWTAHGDVRVGDFQKAGADYWAQRDFQQVAQVTRIESGPVFGLIEADIDWLTRQGVRQLSETRTYTFYKTAGRERIIDVKIVLRFTEGDVMFADTKEGGLLSIRVATSMDEKAGGRMVNSRGKSGMRECWGQPAEWCDYVGPVDGQTLGIAVFDAKTNFRHPTRWHIRDYGLYTANPFMAGSVKGENRKHPNAKDRSGTHTWKKGEAAEFNYRILIHKDDTRAAKVAEQYKLYSDPPKVTTEP